jgi:hypothetical protein
VVPGAHFLADTKTRWRFLFDIADVNVIDYRCSWSFPQPRREFVNCPGLTTSKDLDATIVKIDGVTGNAESSGYAPCAVAKENTLYAALDRKQSAECHVGVSRLRIPC